MKVDMNSKNSNKKAVIWDWNGTLLDDLDICINGINTYLKERNLNLMTRDTYREVFDFPIKDYYTKIGFDFEKEDFGKLSVKFLETYFNNFNQTRLFDYVPEALRQLQKKGFNNYILSAMEQQALENSVRKFSIEKYFVAIQGANDILAKGKLVYGKELFKNEKLIPEHTCFIGDSLHDKEVADQLNISCILISAGHQSHERLMVNNNLVVKNLREAVREISKIL
ncbi:MAG: HAD family hydrolase [Bacteroidetes bacterium]|nr:MAG: HAD family hydrolase [Bacteroidota bacterium]